MRTSSNILKSIFLAALFGLSMSCLPVPGQAGETGEDPDDADLVMSVDEIAQELSNPVTALRSIFSDFEYRTFQGELPDSESMTSLILFTPSIPFQLDNGKNLLLRATIPFYFDQPVWETYFGHPIWEVDRSYAEFLLRQSPQVTADSGRFLPGHDHIADVTYDVAYGGVSERGFISMFGIAGVLPTSQDISASRHQYLLGPEVALGKSADWGSQDISASRHQYLLGPEVALGKSADWGVIGAWVTHLVDVTGDSDFNTNETTVKVFFAYGLGNGWQIISNPTILYDWEADSGNELLLPIGGGVAKTARIGRTPVKFEFELQKYIESSSRFGPEWLFTFSITPLISNSYMK